MSNDEIRREFARLPLFVELKGNPRAIAIAAQRVEDIAHPDEKLLARIIYEARFGVVVKPPGVLACSAPCP